MPNRFATLTTTAVAAALATLASPPTRAAETITYSYDARGRLIRVVRGGATPQPVTTAYQHDRADNRRRVTTTGSSNPPQP